MVVAINPFKQALHGKRLQIGLWLGLAGAYSAEICAGAGFDWLLIDGEHAPNDLPLMVAQLQAIAAYEVEAVIRLPVGEAWLIKQALDIGARTLLVPMVESLAQAREIVRATRYPPQGIRGVGAALARAANFNRTRDYLTTANEQVCLLLQVESRAGLAAIEEIASLDEVDGLFIGPADLAADMGHLGNPDAHDVQAAISHGLARIQATGKAAGIISSDLGKARNFIEQGASFVAIGSDVGILVQGLRGCLNAIRSPDSLG